MIQPLSHGTYPVPEWVSKALQARRSADTSERQQARIQRRLYESGLPPILRSVTFDTLDPTQNRAAYDLCRQYAHVGTCKDKRGLLLMGPPGCGKSTLAAAILSTVVHNQGGSHSVLFVNVPRALDALRSNIGQHGSTDSPLLSIPSNYLVVLDDFGVGKQTEWVQEQFYNMIDSLYAQQRHVIITTNADDDALNQLSGRLLSRIVGLCETVRMSGKDLRCVNVA